MTLTLEDAIFFHFPDSIISEIKMIYFNLFLAFNSPGYPKNKFTGSNARMSHPSCERNKIYSCFSDSPSSERTMDLVLEMCNTNSIHWCGISGRQLGKLHPSSSLCLALTLLSSVQGLQVCYLFNHFSIWELLARCMYCIHTFSSNYH